MPAIQEQLQAMAMDGRYACNAGAIAGDGQGWWKHHPHPNPLLHALRVRQRERERMQEQLQAMAMDGQGNDDHVASVRSMLKQDCLGACAAE